MLKTRGSALLCVGLVIPGVMANISGRSLDNELPRLGVQEALGLVLKRWVASFPLGTKREEVVSDPFRSYPSLSDSQTHGEVFDQHTNRSSTLWSQEAKVKISIKVRTEAYQPRTSLPLAQLYLELQESISIPRQEDRTFLKLFLKLLSFTRQSNRFINIYTCSCVYTLLLTSCNA